MSKLSTLEKELMLNEITFYSICSEEDRQKILGQKPMDFDDFRRLSLLTDYLKLTHLHKFIWDMHAHNFMEQIEGIYQKCQNRDENIPDMLMETRHWLDDFWKQAPNQTVAYLLHQVFADGLDEKE